jgi:hypothetical protein
MKSKFIFIILLFSLFLNIVHDLVIANQASSCYASSVEFTLSVDDNHHNASCQEIAELHEKFHFSAILQVNNVAFFKPIQRTLLFRDVLPPSSIDQTTLKPPIA